MKLLYEDAELFFKLYWGLLYYVNQKHQVIKGLTKPILKGQDANSVNKLNEYLFAHTDLINSFEKENPLHYNKEELTIIKNWKNFVKGDFLILEHKKEYSLLLKSDKEYPKVYGIIGLQSTIEEITPPFLPLYIYTTILPFKEKIVYCGLINARNIYFGGGIRRTINQDYQKAKSMYGIITSLNHSSTPKENKDEELLRFYLKNEDNRLEFEEEIKKILIEHPELYIFSQQEISKSYVRVTKKKLRSQGIVSGWFALLHDTIVSSGNTKIEVHQQILERLPKEKQNGVYIFQFKK